MLDILLAEDDEDTSALLGDLLRMRGYGLRTAKDGEEALRMIDVRFPQIVITDVEMPVLDGPAMVYRLFVEDLGRENIPVILLSGHPNLSRIAFVIGTPYFLAKPFDVDALTSLVERAKCEAIPPRFAPRAS